MTALFVLFFFALSGACATPTHLEIEAGKAFPDLELSSLMHAEDYGKLGMDRAEGSFRISEISGDYLVIEFFNKSCVPCQRQVREMESYYKELSSGEGGSPIRVLAVAVGGVTWGTAINCDGDCRVDRRGAGIALFGSGVALASTGALLLLLERRYRSRLVNVAIYPTAGDFRLMVSLAY